LRDNQGRPVTERCKRSCQRRMKISIVCWRIVAR
jgi:hypothetical protein